jgi:hypothetical protein
MAQIRGDMGKPDRYVRILANSEGSLQRGQSLCEVALTEVQIADCLIGEAAAHGLINGLCDLDCFLSYGDPFGEVATLRKAEDELAPTGHGGECCHAESFPASLAVEGRGVPP